MYVTSPWPSLSRTDRNLTTYLTLNLDYLSIFPVHVRPGKIYRYYYWNIYRVLLHRHTGPPF